MPLVDAKCTNCGAAITVDSNKDAAICEYCGSAFIVEKAINNYNITNHNHINAEVVNVYNGNSSDFVIRAGRLLEYRGASVDAVVPSGVTAIGPQAFACFDRLKSVTLPNGVEIIEHGAFSGCVSLSSIIIPDSVEYISLDAFEGCERLSQVSYNRADENAEVFKGTPFHTHRWGKEWVCQFCGHKNPASVKWCDSCGIEDIGLQG